MESKLQCIFSGKKTTEGTLKPFLFLIMNNSQYNLRILAKPVSLKYVNFTDFVMALRI